MDSSTFLVTGGTGTFGNAVVRRLMNDGFGEIRVFSRDEKKQDDMRQRLADSRLKFYIGDVRDSQSIKGAIGGVDYVFHAAALKQVPSCEFFPLEALRTNSLGAENVLSVAIATGVKRVIVLSTDKAVYPINAMGISKAMMEKLAVAKARVAANETVICCTRYGNVMASRGSVIPLFIKQIQEGQPLTVTDPNMTRFMMPIEGAIDLVMSALMESSPGDTFVPKVPSASIGTVAQAVKEVLNASNPIRIIGTRHGEKLYETLLTREEMAVAEDRGTYYRIPADNRDLNYNLYFNIGRGDIADKADYNSHNTRQFSVDDLAEVLLSLEIVQRARAGERIEE